MLLHHFNILSWFDTKIIFPIFFIFILNLLVVFLWGKKIYQDLGVAKYKSLQRIHINETPRLGGLILYLGVILWVFFCNDELNKKILSTICLSMLPAIFIATKEDLYYNVRPLLRLFALTVSGFLFFFLYEGPLPHLERLMYIGVLFENQYLLLTLLLIGLISIANGMNLIDGVNGLCVSVGFSMLLCLGFLSNLVHDITFLNITVSLILLLFPFFFVNYPKGKIFFGDAGAYFIGFLTGALNIIFFGRHPELSPMNALLILIYPAIEVIFTVFRRLFYSKTSIHKPDVMHLHLELFRFLRVNTKLKKMANNLVMPTLAILWLLPFILITLSYKKSILIILSMIFFSLIYFLIYSNLSKLNKR